MMESLQRVYTNVINLLLVSLFHMNDSSVNCQLSGPNARAEMINIVRYVIGAALNLFINPIKAWDTVRSITHSVLRSRRYCFPFVVKSF